MSRAIKFLSYSRSPATGERYAQSKRGLISKDEGDAGGRVEASTLLFGASHQDGAGLHELPLAEGAVVVEIAKRWLMF